METVAIVGVGLIGASFGLALRKSGFTGPILGVSSPPAMEAGLASGAISSAATLKQAADQADLIYLAQPVDRIIDTLGWLGPMARQGAVITDAGSTKAAIVKAGQSIQYAEFIGGHPMAGKETRGAQSADADLFRNRLYVLTPEYRAVPQSLRNILQLIGANVLEMTAAEHDATVALTSHLPQLISTALAAFLANQKNANIEQVFGSGLLDMTRLAMSPAELWSSILATNKENVLQGIDLFTRVMLDLKQAVQDDNLDALFSIAASFSSHLRSSKLDK
jgi:prephenate dehydrogenase